MGKKQTYEELQQRVKELEKEVAKRKWAEKAIRESEEKFKAITGLAKDAIIMMDNEGNISYWNEAAEKTFGYSAHEALGKELHIFLAPEKYHDPYRRGILTFKRTGHGPAVGKTLELEAVRKDGTRFPIELSVSAVKIEEKWHATGIVRDISQRKQAEEALHLAHRDLAGKAADLEAANEELSQYAYVVSHDLKAPLRAIHNYTDFLREDLEGRLEGDEKTYLDSIHRTVRQAEQLVEDLLEFSRVGRKDFSTQAIDIGVFLKELIASLGLFPDVEVAMANDWPTIDTDPTLLRQVFQDLIKNAIKFNVSPRKRVVIGCLPADDEHYQLFVRDNGIGIERRHYEKIFGMFQRLHTREEYDGTGLGLAIVRKATGKLRGSICVESEPGEGSTFFITLPKRQTESQDKQTASFAKVAKAGEEVAEVGAIL